LLDSLRFPSITERAEAISEAHSQTFQWLFRPPEESVQFQDGRRWDDFYQWLEKGSGLYWVNGKAGSGKSTLMKYVSHNHLTPRLLQSWAGTSKLCILNFYFWSGGTVQQRSQSGLFRSLLYYTLREIPELIPVVLPAQWARTYSAKCIPFGSSPVSIVSAST